MYIRFQLSSEGPKIIGRLNGRALRLFSEQSGRSITAAIGQVVDWWKDDTKAFSETPLDPLDIVAAAYALANCERAEKVTVVNGAPTPGRLKYSYEDIEEELDDFGVVSLMKGFGVALEESAEAYASNPLIGPILKQISEATREIGTAAASSGAGSSSGPSAVEPSESPAA